MTAVKNMVLAGRRMVLQEVQIVSGRSTCDIFHMICGPVDTCATILKQLDGSVTLHC